MLVAITGCIGSGKSYLLEIIHNQKGYDTFNADIIAKEAYKDNKIKKQIKDVFGTDDYNIIKTNVNNFVIKKLNLIIHPYVRNRLIELKELYKDSMAFVEVPLLFETKMNDIFDYTIAISTKRKDRMKRLRERNPETFKKMVYLSKKQYSDYKKRHMSDYIIYSNYNENDNSKELFDIIKVINKGGQI